ncbi:RNA methyltransferase [Pararhodonellum marinum]|uniref:RNA methyltransferase n=1 Tax=Pararhodonellum marinum TaxID=2755358 RepID=UPI00188E09DE|nr:RNA methyltransferase [Pararhodonellum marinum]
MPSKNTLKFIKSLQQKKFRRQENSFFVEGTKNVTELLRSDYKVTHLLYTEKFQKEQSEELVRFGGEQFLVSPKVLESCGGFQSNDSALAVAQIKSNENPPYVHTEWVLALDEVRDPGNLGTIIRIADWYGIQNLILSEGTADFYNPKVLQASMGSFTRVKVFYTELAAYLKNFPGEIYGAFLGGESIHGLSLPSGGLLVMGSESHGISPHLEAYISKKITIPRYGQAESLNVAVATAIICDNLKRYNSQVL